MEKILIVALIVSMGLTFGLSYAIPPDVYLKVIELDWKFDHGYFQNPESDYSKFLESIGGSTMIIEDEIILKRSDGKQMTIEPPDREYNKITLDEIKNARELRD